VDVEDGYSVALSWLIDSPQIKNLKVGVGGLPILRDIVNTLISPPIVALSSIMKMLVLIERREVVWQGGGNVVTFDFVCPGPCHPRNKRMANVT
jgi:hypothetical protein